MAARNTKKSKKIEAQVEVEAQVGLETPETPEAAPKRSMADTLRAHRGGYEATIASSGKHSLHNGDVVAAALAGLEPKVALAAAQSVADAIGTDIDLEAKYIGSGGWDKPKLNAGQIRMNSGNRVRGALKRGDITEAEALSHIDAARRMA
jgi:hypothetical protein